MRNIRNKMANRGKKNSMFTDRTKLLSIIWYLVLFFFFAALIYFSLGQSLHLSLWGDDWQLFYIIEKVFGPGKVFPYLTFRGYTEPHGIMKLWLLILRRFLNFNDFGYYFISSFLRMMSAFAGYLFLSKFVKSKWIGLLGSLFVLVGYAGIDTTEYMVHMTTYFVIMFLFLSLYFFIDSYGKFGKFLAACLLYSISLVANPLRSHGLVPFVVVFDLLYGIFVAKISVKNILGRQIFIWGTIFIVYKLGFFGSVGAGFINIPVITQMIKDGNYTFISAFIATLGKVYLPDLYSIDVTFIVRLFGANWFKWVVGLGFLLEVVAFHIIMRILKRPFKEFFMIIGLLFLDFSITALIFRGFFRGGELLNNLTFTFLGIFFLTNIFWGLYVLYISKKEKISTAWLGVVAGPVLTLTLLIVPLLFTPGTVLESTHRYLTVGLVGVAVTVVSFLSITKDTKSKRNITVTTVFFLLILLLDIRADRIYFSELLITRNPQVSHYMWNQFFDMAPNPYPTKLSLFYFDDSQNVRLSSDAFLYGFPPRVGLQYNIPTYAQLPAMTDIYQEIVSAVTDGKSFKRLGYPVEKIGIDQVFAFRIDKNGELTDITRETRNDLSRYTKVR